MVKNIISILLTAAALASNLAFAGPAIHIDGRTCYVLDGNGNYTTVDSEHEILTDSGNGVVVCTGFVAPPANGKARVYKPKNINEVCDLWTQQDEEEGEPFLRARTWIETVSASGHVTLTCHVHR